MVRKRQALLIGSFVIGAIALLAVVLIAFGSGALFREELDFVAYFDGSVKGLRVGAPITFRGVRVGAVSDMRITADQETGRILIPVDLRFEPDQFVFVNGDADGRNGEDFIRKLIQKGLKAQCQLQSVVTGQLMVELDFFPDRPMVFRGRGIDLPEMPTIPSRARELARTFEELPVGEILTEVSTAVQSVSRLVNSETASRIVRSTDEGLERLVGILETAGPVVDELKATLAEARTVFSRVNDRIDPMTGEMRAAIGQAGVAFGTADREIPLISQRLMRTADAAETLLSEARKAFDSVDSLAGDRSPLRYELTETLRAISEAARSVQGLAEGLEQRPESLFRGKPR
ncbi:MAG: MlaD family protein [Desulfobacterales bacterium]